MPSKNAGLAKAYGKPRSTAPKAQRKPRAPAANQAAVRRLICDKICSVCDPTCPSACGAKMMGQDSSRTFSFTHKSILTLTSDANGHGARWFTPGINDYTSVHSSITAGGVVTFAAATDLPEATSLIATAHSYRVVSAAIRVFSIAAPTASSGRVQVVQTQTGEAVPVGYDITSLLYEEVDTDSLYAFDKTYVFRREGAEASAFHAASSATGHPGWNGIVISVDGVPASTAVLQFEVTYHFELQPDPITIYSRLADPPAKHIPALEAAIANVSRNTPMGGDSESWSKKIMDFAYTEASALITQYGAKELLAILL